MDRVDKPVGFDLCREVEVDQMAKVGQMTDVGQMMRVHQGMEVGVAQSMNVLRGMVAGSCWCLEMAASL